jgi:hypothetical protein
MHYFEYLSWGVGCRLQEWLRKQFLGWREMLLDGSILRKWRKKKIWMLSMALGMMDQK